MGRWRSYEPEDFEPEELVWVEVLLDAKTDLEKAWLYLRSHQETLLDLGRLEPSPARERLAWKSLAVALQYHQALHFFTSAESFFQNIVHGFGTSEDLFRERLGQYLEPPCDMLPVVASVYLHLAHTLKDDQWPHRAFEEPDRQDAAGFVLMYWTSGKEAVAQ